MKWRFEILNQTLRGMVNYLAVMLGPGAIQFFWYLLPFVVGGLITFIFYKKKLKKEYYWLAYGAFLGIVCYYANYLSFTARDTIRVWLDVLWFWHSPVVIPVLMIVPVLWLMVGLHCFGYGRWAQKEKVNVK